MGKCFRKYVGIKIQLTLFCACLTECVYDGRTYSNGESWKNDCLFCSCLNSAASCSDMDCRDRCVHEGQMYEPGSNRSDSCNSCVCNAGAWTCTERECGKTCSFRTVVYLQNEKRKDDCNTCTCDGQWLCTTKDCKADPIQIKVEFSFMADFNSVSSKQVQFSRLVL